MRHPLVGPDADLLVRTDLGLHDVRRPETAQLPHSSATPRSSGADSRYVPRHGSTVIPPVHGRAPVAPPPRGPVIPATGPLARALHHLLRSAAAAVQTRQATSTAPPGGGISITPASAAAPLVIRDDGVGLTAAEVRGLLSASVSGTALAAAAGERAESADLAATVRACLRVADVVEIRSRSTEHPEAATLRAVIRADGPVRVSLAGATLTEPGTEVRLHLHSRYRSAVGEHLLPALVRDLADQLTVPVEVAGSPVATTGRVPDLAPEDLTAWCRERLGVDPLAVLPLGAGPHGTRAVAVVLPAPATPEGSAGHRVTVDGLRVADGPDDLLPTWAGFARVVLEAGDLPLTVDGALAPGAALDEVRAHLARAVVAGLILLEAYEPDRFGLLTGAHEDAVLAAALAHRDDMERIRALLPVPTSRGPLTLEDFHGVEGAVACAGADTWATIGPVAARDGVLVVDARHPGVLRVLETLGTEGPDVAVLRPSNLAAFGIAG